MKRCAKKSSIKILKKFFSNTSKCYLFFLCFSLVIILHWLYLLFLFSAFSSQYCCEAWWQKWDVTLWRNSSRVGNVICEQLLELYSHSLCTIHFALAVLGQWGRPGLFMANFFALGAALDLNLVFPFKWIQIPDRQYGKGKDNQFAEEPV